MRDLNIKNFVNIISTLSNQAAKEKAEQEIKFGKKISNSLTFKYVELDAKYAEKWNERSIDFGHLYKNGKKISNTLYRIGGLGIQSKNGYFMLIKHIEAHYNKKLLKMAKSTESRHLESQFCILNKHGIEKVNFKQFASPYIHGIIYSLDNKYYNIETGELYCSSYSSMHSDTYLFLDNKYDDDILKKGILRINKKTGTYRAFN